MFYEWRPYVSVAERRRKAAREMDKLAKKGHPVSPVVIEGRAIAQTFWGKSWCDNLERYSDYSNRLPRGRTYVRNGSVVDLQIASGEISAHVSGSELYKVNVKVSAVPKVTLEFDLRRLRRGHRLAGGIAARAFLERGHGAHLPAKDRAFPRADRDHLHL
jgi:hypothetical protein